MEKVIGEHETKKYNKFQWFLVVIVIPTIFTFIVGGLVATVAGINVIEKAKEFSAKLPFVPTNEEILQEEKINEMETKLSDLQAEVNVREEAIKVLESEIDSKDKELASLKLEKEQLQMQIDELVFSQEKGNQSFKEIVSTYETMSAKKAAPIISQMNEKEALEILTNLKPATLAAILEKMEASVAAKFTSLLTNNSSKESGDS